MNSRTALILMLLASTYSTQAKLSAGPQIVSVALDPQNADSIHLRVTGLSCKAAASTNGGWAFSVSPEDNVPNGWNINLYADSRRYVIADSTCLLRSDDGGLTWTNTAASSFLRKQSMAKLQQEENRFRTRYGARLPEQSSLWHPMFGTYACAYCFLTFFFLRRHGSLPAILTGLRGLVVLILFWCLLWGFHTVVMRLMDFILGDGNSYAMIQPSPKLGLAMAITAFPLPLLGYLLFLWPVLPGSVDILGRTAIGLRRRSALIIATTMGTAFVAFHLWMMFVGCWW